MHVTPAKAGIQSHCGDRRMPAFAGMTKAGYSIVTCTAFDAPDCNGKRAWMRCAPGFIGQ